MKEFIVTLYLNGRRLYVETSGFSPTDAKANAAAMYPGSNVTGVRAA